MHLTSTTTPAAQDAEGVVRYCVFLGDVGWGTFLPVGALEHKIRSTSTKLWQTTQSTQLEMH